MYNAQEALKSCLHYDPDTGLFTWIKPANYRYRKGRTPRTEAGRVPDKTGYSKIQFGGFRVLTHRLAWLYMTGELPTLFIDHIDGDKMNNRFSNLRECTRSENSCNSRTQEGREIKGVHLVKKTGRYNAIIAKDGIRHNKTFDTEKEAVTWLANKRADLHQQFARG
jgi:hypothetical protein